jgi:hypothetical protein
MLHRGVVFDEELKAANGYERGGENGQGRFAAMVGGGAPPGVASARGCWLAASRCALSMLPPERGGVGVRVGGDGARTTSWCFPPLRRGDVPGRDPAHRQRLRGLMVRRIRQALKPANPRRQRKRQDRPGGHLASAFAVPPSPTLNSSSVCALGGDPAGYTISLPSRQYRNTPRVRNPCGRVRIPLTGRIDCRNLQLTALPSGALTLGHGHGSLRQLPAVAL